MLVGFKMTLGEIICLGIDAAILTVVYKFYSDTSKSLHSIKSAPSLEISSDIKEEVQKYAQGCIPYAVIRGTVKAIEKPIVSQNASDVAGVIHESTLREHKIQWSWATRWWTEVKKDLSRTTNTVPFGLQSYKGGELVEVLEPLDARGLELKTVHDVFKPSQLGFWDSITRFFIGETTTGYQQIEKMLPEGSALTGVGALVLQHGKVCLQPPGRGYAYYLTQMSEGTLIKNLESETNTLKWLAIMFGTFGGVLLTVIVVKYYQKRKEQAERSAELRRMREIIDEQNRLRAEAGTGDGDEGLPADRLCVVCQENPREVLILECGHLCCCAQCGQLLDPPLCPVCRAPIDRLVPAFVP